MISPNIHHLETPITSLFSQLFTNLLLSAVSMADAIWLPKMSGLGRYIMWWINTTTFPPVLVGILGAIYFSGLNCTPARIILKFVITEECALTKMLHTIVSLVQRGLIITVNFHHNLDEFYDKKVIFHQYADNKRLKTYSYGQCCQKWVWFMACCAVCNSILLSDCHVILREIFISHEFLPNIKFNEHPLK